MIKKMTIGAIVCASILFACKKKDEQPTTPGTSTAGSTNSGSTTGGTSTTPFYGAFSTVESRYESGNGEVTLSNARAYFSSAPVTAESSATGITVGSVTFNGDIMVYDSAGIYSPADPFSIDLSSENWNVTGANGIPSFTIANAVQSPSGLNYTGWPAVISKGTGVTVNLGTLANVKTGQIVIIDGTANSAGKVFKNLGANEHEITFIASQLSGFQTGGQGAMIVVTLENSEFRTIDGKNFKFKRQVVATKSVAITN